MVEYYYICMEQTIDYVVIQYTFAIKKKVFHLTQPCSNACILVILKNIFFVTKLSTLILFFPSLLARVTMLIHYYGGKVHISQQEVHFVITHPA